MSWRRTKRRWRRRLRRLGGAAGVGVAVVAVLVLVGVGFGLWHWNRTVDDSVSAVGTEPADPQPSDEPAACPPPQRLAVLGDSTRDETAAGQPFIAALRDSLGGTTVKSFGMNGVSLDRYLDQPAQQQAREWSPDAVELSIGINDLRLDQSAERVSQFRTDLASYVDDLHRDLPDATFVLSVPAALNTHDVDGTGFVQPPEAAEQVTRQLRAAYLAVAKDRPWLVLNDVQAEVTGTKADTSNPPRFLSDQVHPNPDTAREVASLVTGALTASC